MSMILLALALVAGQAPDCADPDTQLEMTECAAKRFRAADAAMNAQWRKTLAHMRALDKDSSDLKLTGPGYAQVLLDAQRAWLVFRDAHCRSIGYDALGGSMQNMLVSECQEKLTRERTAQLADQVDRNAM
jgi:uncharacterized protein YecT (DUF1311 family)